MKYLALAFSVLLGSLAAMPSAWAHEDEVPPKQLGEVAFANSCAAQAQESFERGVALLHSFGFADGAQAFREALDRDPTCAIANWGIAAILIGNTFSVGPTQEDAHAALAAIDRGRAIGAKTERERDYIEAIAAYYDHFAERSHAARMRSLADAFEALAQRYADDDETQIFSALYLTATQSPADKSYTRTLRAAAILETQFAKHPNHPGVAHYLIHSYDYPAIAQKGLPAALCYAGVAPDAAHALHMPSHIFTRVGSWRESIDTNARSVAAAKAQMDFGEALHAMDYMVYADLQLGRDGDALAEVKVSVGLPNSGRAATYARAAIPARYAVERDQWREAAALADPADSKFPYTGAMTLFARASVPPAAAMPPPRRKTSRNSPPLSPASRPRKTITGRPKSRCSASAPPPGSPLPTASARRRSTSCAPRPTWKTRARRAPFLPAASCRRASFSATCCSKVAAQATRLPPTKPRSSRIRSACAASTAPAGRQRPPAMPTKRASISAAWSRWRTPIASAPN